MRKTAWAAALILVSAGFCPCTACARAAWRQAATGPQPPKVTPDPLPAVALGSVVLLHLERALVLLAGFFFVMVVVVRTWRGELPVELSGRGLKYAVQELQESTKDALDALAEEGERELSVRNSQLG